MASFRNAGHPARVEWIGRVPDRESSLRSSPLDSAMLEFAGFAGESHGGLTRPSCVRVEDLYEQGTEIRNTRQLSIVSAEELDEIARRMEVDLIEPRLLGASLVISGIPRLTLVPPGSRLQFQGGATVTVDLENLPCNLPAREIEREKPGFGRKFKAAARNRRGVTAWVEREGSVSVGDRVCLFVPVQPHWPDDSRLIGTGPELVPAN